MGEASSRDIFKVGDVVYDSIGLGRGVVQCIDSGFNYPVVVKFDCGGERCYKLDGRFTNSDLYPSLSFTEYKLEGFSQERPIDYNDYIGEWGFFWDKDFRRKMLSKLIGFDLSKENFRFRETAGLCYANFKPTTPEVKQQLIKSGIINE